MPRTELTPSAPPSEVGSSRRGGTLPRAHSFRRSHSVDEGTQTEASLDEQPSDDHLISDNEARELGYLVDIMKYYNSNLDNLNGIDANSNLNTDTQVRRPRTVDRSRQARLSSTTYSSSNNSEAGENHIQNRNHVNNNIGPPCGRITAAPRYNTFGHKSHSLRHCDTLDLENPTKNGTQNGAHRPAGLSLENGLRRPAGRTRVGFPSTVSDRVSARPYGTLG